MDSREGSDKDEDEGDYRFNVRAEPKLGELTTSWLERIDPQRTDRNIWTAGLDRASLL